MTEVTDAPDLRRPVDAQRAEILERLLTQFTPPGRVIDLACGTGLFAGILAAAGWQVTALDARRRDWAEHPRVTWLEQDVRDADPGGYDLVLCLGIFYHLELADQLALLARCEKAPLILDTHVSLTGDIIEDGYAGHYYAEGGDQLSAWGNARSFWPAEESLRRMLAAHGYATVEAVEPWYHGNDRTFFTCLP